MFYFIFTYDTVAAVIENYVRLSFLKNVRIPQPARGCGILTFSSAMKPKFVQCRVCCEFLKRKDNKGIKISIKLSQITLNLFVEAFISPRRFDLLFP